MNPPTAVQAAPTAVQTTNHEEHDAEGGRYPKNAFFIEALGSGGAYSVNYDRLLFPLVSVRGGVGVIGVSGSPFITLPVTVNFLPALRGPHRLEFGLGATVALAPPDRTGTTTAFTVRNGWGIAAAGVIGYRYVPVESGWTFRVSFTPLLQEHLYPWVGVSGGYAF